MNNNRPYFRSFYNRRSVARERGQPPTAPAMDSGGRERNATSTLSRARAVEARVSVEYTAYNNQSLSMSIISAIV